MILPAQSQTQGRRHTLLALSITAALGVLGWSIAVRTMNIQSPSHDPDTALRSRNVDLLVWLAHEHLPDTPTDGDLHLAERLATRALQETPLASGAVRALGLVAHHRGNEARALALISTAAERWKYDIEAQLWAIDYNIKSGEIRAALQKVDNLLRAQPFMRREIFPRLFSLAADAMNLDDLADALTSSPPWRTAFLTQFFAEAEPAMMPYRLVLALRDRASPPTVEELRPFLERLVDREFFNDAREIWGESIPSERQPGVSSIYNEGFEYAITNVPFDWSFYPVAGASMEVVRSPSEPHNSFLHVAFYGGRVPFQHVRQTLLLSPGAYRLTVKAKATDLINERGLWWTVSCVNGQPLGETDRILGTTSWIVLEGRFLVPPRGCRAQRLQLELAARVALEQKVSGQAWFDDVIVDAGSPLKTE